MDFLDQLEPAAIAGSSAAQVLRGSALEDLDQVRHLRAGVRAGERTQGKRTQQLGRGLVAGQLPDLERGEASAGLVSRRPVRFAGLERSGRPELSAILNRGPVPGGIS